MRPAAALSALRAGLGGSFGRPVKFVLQAQTYDELQRAMGVLLAEAQKLGYLVNMDTDLKLNKPQLEIDIDRDRAAALGVSVTEIGNTLQSLLGSRKVSNFKLGNEQYNVILQVPARDRSSPSIIDDIYVRGSRGLVQLASVVHVSEKVSPRELNHFNRIRSATLNANLLPGVTIGQAVTCSGPREPTTGASVMSTSAHAGTACPQRGMNGQPGVASRRSGGEPGMPADPRPLHLG